MSTKDNRALGRIGAHELKKEQTEVVIGGRLLTVPSVIITGTPGHYDESLDS